MKEEEKILRKKAEYFHNKRIPVHIKKKNGYFHNGLIMEFSHDLLILDDIKIGDMPIYLMEIVEIEKQEERK